MKKYILPVTIIALLIALGCKNQQAAENSRTIAKTEAGTPAVNDTVRIANDSIGYQVIIIDNGFNYWLQSRAKPRGYYGEPYLKSKNTIWVSEWNSRAINPNYSDLYEMQIDYSPNIEYGYEVNYLLYNYLVYFQNKYHQKLGGIVPQY